jgi:hypothetical protein
LYAAIIIEKHHLNSMKSNFIPSERSTNPEDSFLSPESAGKRGDELTQSFLEGREFNKRADLEDVFLRDADTKKGLSDVESFERSWHERRPEIPEGRNVHGGDLKQSFQALLHNREELADYAFATDSTVAKHIDRIAPQMIEARAQSDSTRIDKLISDLSRGASGRYSEFIAEKAYSPYFDKVTPQYRSVDGKTITDFFSEGCKSPMNFGKGAFVPKGGSLAVEVKAAKVSYFRSELEGGHLMHQVNGHKVADAGIVISTKNMKITSPEMKKAYSSAPKELRDSARASLNEAGSPLFCFLPPKEEIDRDMMGLLERRMSQLINL